MPIHKWYFMDGHYILPCSLLDVFQSFIFDELAKS
jgi:hypothetical protein